MRYLGPSLDPIFPADLETESGYWIDSSDTVHILGCQEYKEVCDPTGACYEIKAQWDRQLFGTSRSDSQIAALTLMALSLVQSSVSFDHGKIPEFLADQFRTSSLSPALNDEHWQAEVRRLFKISLARLQGGIVNVARGTYSDDPNFQRLWPTRSNEFCPSIMIQTTGWRNLNLQELVYFSTFLLSLWISTIRYKDGVLLALICRGLTGLQAQRLCKLIKKGFSNLVTAMARMVGLER